MRIGKQDENLTATSTAEPEITVRGRDSVRSDRQDRVHRLFLLPRDRQQPTETQRFFADAVLVAIAEHGLVPSVQAARMTLAAAPEAWQGAMSAGLLGVGSVVAGARRPQAAI